MIFMAMGASSGGLQYLFELSKQLNNKEGGKKSMSMSIEQNA
jgi:hypothetical protein